jgi:hypothetical protein
MAYSTRSNQCPANSKEKGAAMSPRNRAPSRYDQIEEIFAIHGIGDEAAELRKGERYPEKINAIIRDIKIFSEEYDQ